MKKIYVVVLAAVLFSANSFAQKGDRLIGIGGGLSLPTGDFGNYFKSGLSLYAKSMFGVGKSGHVTFTGDYTSFKEAGDWEDYTLKVSIVPLLVGYRHNFSGFFVEPQLGYGVYGFKYSGEDGFYSESDGAFTWGANIGYIFNKQVEVTARYQSGSKQGNKIEMFGLRVGYNFSLTGAK